MLAGAPTFWHRVFSYVAGSFPARRFPVILLRHPRLMGTSALIVRAASASAMCAVACLAMAGCSSSGPSQAASASVQCGTVVTSLADLKAAYAQLDAALGAQVSPANLQPIGAKINSLTFDIANQLQGASKDALTAVADGAQSVEDAIAQAESSNTTGQALANEINSAQPSNLDSSIEELTQFAQQACGTKG